MLPRRVFVLGGAASGKSAFAETLVGQAPGRPVYIATARRADGASDAEMQDRIARHRARRGPGWDTREVPEDLAGALDALAAGDAALIDCATLWLSNRMLAQADTGAAQSALIAALERCAATVVVVSNETGQGIVPDNALARQFREAQGRLNIALAGWSDLAVQVVAGLPLVLKGRLP